MAIYIEKVKNSDGGEWDYGIIAENFKEAAKQVDHHSSGTISLKYMFEPENYNEAIDEISHRIECIYSQISMLVDHGSQLVTYIKPAPDNRMENAKQQWYVREITESIRERVDEATELLNLFHGYTEDMIDKTTDEHVAYVKKHGKR